MLNSHITLLWFQMIRVVDVSTWRKQKHNEDQMVLFNHLEFMPIQSHGNLFVVDVTDEEMIMLTFMGVNEAKDINTDYNLDFKPIGSTKFLHKTQKGFVIVQVSGDTFSSG